MDSHDQFFKRDADNWEDEETDSAHVDEDEVAWEHLFVDVELEPLD